MNPVLPPDPPCLTKRYAIRTDELTAEGTLAFPALMLYLQDAAGCHAASLGWSMQRLGAEGKGWVLASCRFELQRLPGWQEVLEVETWPSGIDRLFARRDYRLRDGQGREVGRGESRWLILDREKRRPVRLPRQFAEDVGRHLSPQFDEAPTPIETGFDGLELARTRIRRSDLDVNRHVNHVRYLEWIFAAADSAASEETPARVLAGVEVEFRAEGFEGEEVAVRLEEQSVSAPGGSGVYALGRVADCQILAAARLRFQPPA